MNVCKACSRHVRGDRVCPFCGATMAEESKTSRRGRARRAAMLGAAAIGVACGGKTAPPDDGGPTDAKKDQQEQQDVAVAPPYGAPPLDGGTD